MSKHQNEAAPTSGFFIAITTAFALIAFAANSVLTRLALYSEAMDPNAFTLLRLASGALVLALIFMVRTGVANQLKTSGSWRSGVLLWLYAGGFSLAYVVLDTATGAFLLFTSVQLTMLAMNKWRGQKLRTTELIGAAVAIVGFIYLLMPHLQVPQSLFATLAMIVAGVSWGWYSYRGKSSAQPSLDTAGNFMRAVPFALLVFVVDRMAADQTLLLPANGVLLAVLSGAITSGLGYVIWYRVLPHINVSTAAVGQLLVPVIAAIGGWLWLAERVDERLWIAGIVILVGIAITLIKTRAKRLQ